MYNLISSSFSLEWNTHFYMINRGSYLYVSSNIALNPLYSCTLKKEEFITFIQQRWLLRYAKNKAVNTHSSKTRINSPDLCTTIRETKIAKYKLKRIVKQPVVSRGRFNRHVQLSGQTVGCQLLHVRSWNKQCAINLHSTKIHSITFQQKTTRNILRHVDIITATWTRRNNQDILSKTCADELPTILWHIFLYSFQSRILPDSWKRYSLYQKYQTVSYGSLSSTCQK